MTMTETENGRVDILVGLVESVQKEVKELARQHAAYQAAAATRDAHLQQQTAAMSALQRSIENLTMRMESVERRIGWLPTSDRILSYTGMGLIGGVVGAVTTAIVGTG